MLRTRTRTHATLACINCRQRHERCERLPGKDICTNCREYNRSCVSIPGNRRGPKSRRQNHEFANLQPFSNINPYSAIQTQHSHPVSRVAHTQYQPTTGIEYSGLTPGVCTQYQLAPSVESYSYLIPEKYQEQLTPCSLCGLYPVSGTTEVFQNTLTNQSSSTSFLSPSFTHEESALNIDRPTISDPSITNLTSLSNPFNYC
ncbi:17589_t:CDS:1 [Cetraspora pellucida]|uniref:17589_t:CDS:1 n=1 Tax=Cetraspora pellucida TaxID=1433469 RepID=A0A9N9FHU7_9GLOM|nr:17589_t:CDS:1 [Cetraspora pellucida]